MKLFKIKLLLFLLPATGISVNADSPVIKTMTYNIRYENGGDTGTISWANRKNFILSTILYHHAEIIGMQEVLHQQLQFFDSSLKNFSHVGAGREDGKEKGEYAPIFFNHTIFERIQDSTFWLSPTHNLPSKGWDAALERICTWVRLKDKRNGQQFFIFNTHFDHLGQKAREESAKLLLNQIKSIAKDLPVILTGDFNSAEASDPIRILTGKMGAQNYTLKDAMYLSELPHHGSYTTFCGFNLKDGVIGDRIDYIFVSRHFKVISHATLTDFKGDHFPSDHFPVLAEIQLQ